MALADAISALAPSIWYRLDETSGTIAVNSGSMNNNGTISGSVTLGQTGPELGTTAMRLYTGGQIISGAMDLSTGVNQTLALMVSMDASGTVNVGYPIVNIGDPNNRVARGIYVYEGHTATGNPKYYGTYAGNSGVQGTAPYPGTFWHWVVFTWAVGTNGAKIYIDGQLWQQANQVAGPNPVLSDPLLIRCDEPAVVAHVCWWGSILTQTQIQSVSAQMAGWPFTLPINTPPVATGGATGGFTDTDRSTLNEVASDTDTLLSNWAGYTGTTLPSLQDMLNSISSKVDSVKTDTSNMVNSLFPQLADELNSLGTAINNVLEAVTATISNAAGSVAQTIGQLFSQHSHDEFGVFNVTSGPTCSPIHWTAGAAAYWGLSVNITSWPTEWTFTTPDDGWSIRDLAVLTIEIEGEQQVRYGIHTKTFGVNPLPSTLPIAVAGVGVPVTPPNYTIDVVWAGGVCGELLLYYLPVGP